MPSARHQPAPSAGGKPKDPYFSNAKFILIVLVVCGHAWALVMGDNDIVRGLYYTLYDFHMPAFILICGYFSKSFTARPDQMQRLIAGVLAPYLIFSILYGTQRIWTGGEFKLSLFHPYYLLWFLVALFVWRLTAPLWRRIKYPVAVATIIGVAAIVLNLPTEFDFGRILQFLPFFVAGMFLTREHFTMLKRPVFRYGGLVLTIGLTVAAIMFNRSLNRNWIYFNEGAPQMDVGIAMGLGLKLVLLATSVILVATFFAWVPDRQLPISRFGDLTMYTFLLHGLVIKGVEASGLYDWPPTQTALGAVATTVGAITVALLLMSPPVRWVTRPLVEPRLDWMFTKQPSTTTAR
ncbi:Fucose 4-O-acetylase-like acetyltransferase [Stackebrandtia soli]